MAVVFGNLQWLPVICGVWFIFTMVITYVIAVIRQDVNPIWPYISDTGTFPPESCVFGQLLNMGTILIALIAYIRYLQIKSTQHNAPDLAANVSRLNNLSLHLGWLSAFGLMMVANFQKSNQIFLHFLGASLGFGLGIAYQFVAWKISAIVRDNAKRNNFRLFCACGSLLSFLICNVFAILGRLNFQGSDITKWRPDEGGYVYHLISTSFEWFLALFTVSFIMTFYDEFRQIQIQEPVILLNNKQ